MATTAPPPTTTEAQVWHVLSTESATRELDVEPERGLTSEEAAARIAGGREDACTAAGAAPAGGASSALYWAVRIEKSPRPTAPS